VRSKRISIPAVLILSPPTPRICKFGNFFKRDLARREPSRSPETSPVMINILKFLLPLTSILPLKGEEIGGGVICSFFINPHIFLGEVTTKKGRRKITTMKIYFNPNLFLTKAFLKFFFLIDLFFSTRKN